MSVAVSPLPLAGEGQGEGTSVRRFAAKACTAALTLPSPASGRGEKHSAREASERYESYSARKASGRGESHHAHEAISRTRPTTKRTAHGIILRCRNPHRPPPIASALRCVVPCAKSAPQSRRKTHRRGESADRTLESIPEFLVDRTSPAIGRCRRSAAESVFGGMRSREQNYHLPILDAHKRMLFAPWQNGDAITINRYGISEPSDPQQTHRARSAGTGARAAARIRSQRQSSRLRRGLLRSHVCFSERPQRGLRNRSWSASATISRKSRTMTPNAWDVPMDFIATDRELIDCTSRIDP